MGNFVSRLVIEREFDGDKVRLTAKPMAQTVAVKLHSLPSTVALDAAGNVLLDKEGEQVMTKGEEATQLLLAAFLEHLETVEGVKDADGNALPLGTLKETAYFVGLLIDAAGEWAERSLPAGKSKPSAQ